MKNKILFLILNFCLATGDPGHWGDQPNDDGYEHYGDRGVSRDASMGTIDKTPFVSRCQQVRIF